MKDIQNRNVELGIGNAKCAGGGKDEMEVLEGGIMEMAK